MEFKDYINFDNKIPSLNFDKVVDELTPEGIQEYYDDLMKMYISLGPDTIKSEKEQKEEIEEYTIKGCEIICKVTNFCNQNCSYCFDYNNRKEPRRVLSTEHIMKLLRLLRQMNFKEVSWIWHGGECFSVNKEWFDNVCFEMEKYALFNDMTIKFSAQSNGTLLDKDWEKLIDKYNIAIGTSYDWSAQNKRGYKLADEQLCKFSFIISIVENENVRNLITDYEAAKKKQIPFSFNFVFSAKGKPTSDYLDVDVLIEEYKKYFDYFLYDPNPKLSERSALGLIGKAINKEADTCNLHNCLLSYRICVNSDGTLWKCDDTNLKELYVCSLDEIQSLEEFFGSKEVQHLKDLKQLQISNYCIDCDLLPICGQGCLHCSLTESGGKKPYSFHCKFYKAIMPYIYEKIGNLTPEEFVKLNPCVKQYLIQKLYIPAYKKEELKKIWEQ